LQVLQRQQNLISFRQLDQAGVSRRVRDRLVAEGALEPVAKSVLSVAGCGPSFVRRAITVCLQHPQGHVSGPAAGRLVGLRRMPKLTDIAFVVPHGSRVDVPVGVRLRQSSVIPPDHRRHLDNGVVVANWARLAFDLAADLPWMDLLSVIEQMLHEGRTSMPELSAVGRLLCRPGRSGSGRFAFVLSQRGGRAPAESHPELRVLRGLQRLGVPVVPQLRHLALPNGQAVRIDMAVEEVRWAVEVDVHPAHGQLFGTTKDKRRDRQLHLIDWQVERVTQLDLLDLRGMLDELHTLYLARVAAVDRR
jgi:hypothetical protein